MCDLGVGGGKYKSEKGAKRVTKGFRGSEYDQSTLYACVEIS
jgi:hypothetical protein